MTVTRDLLETQLTTPSHVKPEAVQFLLQLQKKEFGIDAYLVDANTKISNPDPARGEIEHIDKVLQDLKTRHANSESHRAQLIVHNNGHYTAVDVEICKGEITNSFIVDAANDMRFMSVVGALAKAKAPDETMYIACADSNVAALAEAKKTGTEIKLPARMRAIQSDKKSCPYFCLDHVVQLSKTATIYTDLKKSIAPEDDMMPGVNWTDLPPQLLWNVQSLTWAKEYAEMHPERAKAEIHNGESFTSYIEKGTTYDGKIGRNVNNSIELNVFRPLQEKAQQYLSQSTPEQLSSFLQESYKAPTPQKAATMAPNTKGILETLGGGKPSSEIKYGNNDNAEMNKSSQDKNETKKMPKEQMQIDSKHGPEPTQSSTPSRKM